MRTKLYALITGLALALVSNGYAGGGVEAPGDGARERILTVARSLIGIREATGHNDGPIVEAILASTGNAKGDPWCAAANYYVYSRAGYGYLVPRSAWSPDWVAGATWKQGRGTTPLPADSFGIYFSSLGRVGHTGLIEQWSNSVAVTLEGNTNDQLSRDGDGYYRKRRLTRQIYAVRSWVR